MTVGIERKARKSATTDTTRQSLNGWQHVLSLKDWDNRPLALVFKERYEWSRRRGGRTICRPNGSPD